MSQLARSSGETRGNEETKLGAMAPLGTITRPKGQAPKADVETECQKLNAQ